MVHSFVCDQAIYLLDGDYKPVTWHPHHYLFGHSATDVGTAMNVKPFGGSSPYSTVLKSVEPYRKIGLLSQILRLF